MRASRLVLSIFPGLGLLDRAFDAEGFCVVRGPDPIWGGDVRDFHPPRGVFDGVIGGDPCQSHSALANLVRAKGLEPSFPDMTEDYARIVAEAQPAWFLRENVPQAPGLHVEGYGIHRFLIDNASLLGADGVAQEQIRRRRFWFGVRDSLPPDLRKLIDFAALELPEPALSVTGAHTCHQRPKGGHGEHVALAEMLRLQGLPDDFLAHCPFTVQGKRKAIGNGVPQAMGRALAKAIRGAIHVE